MHRHIHIAHVTPWAVAHQAPLFREFSGQEYRSGLPLNHQEALKVQYAYILTDRSGFGHLVGVKWCLREVITNEAEDGHLH